MLWKRTVSYSPEQAFILVRNSEATALSKGQGVVWDLPIGGSVFDGYAVTLAPSGTATLVHPALLAGVVYPNSIDPGAYGWIQAWGFCDYVGLYGIQTDPFFGAATQWDAASLNGRVLALVNLYNSATPAAGYFGVMKNDNVSVTIPGNFLIPLSYIFTSVSTDGSYISGTLGTTETGFCKAFLRCLS